MRSVSLQAAIFAAATAGLLSGCWPLVRVGRTIETFESEGPAKIRVTARIEEGFTMLIPGGHYFFESRPRGSSKWKQVLVLRHDDPVPIPREQIRRLSDDIAYFFMGWVYAATIDGGATWIKWDAYTDLPNWQCCNYRLIQDVTLRTDGTGTMQCRVIDSRRGEVPVLETRDFGRTWHAKEI